MRRYRAGEGGERVARGARGGVAGGVAVDTFHSYHHEERCMPKRDGDADMANQEQLEILAQGVAAWNAWRKKNPDVRPDLGEAEFSGADLQNANLKWAKLQGANLQGTNLRDANLRDVNLKDANLANADLSNACVSGVRYNRKNSYKGIRVDSCYGSQMFKSHAMDQDYIEEFRSESKIHKYLYYVWLVSSDCGRSMSLWAAWSVVLLSGFAFVYHTLGPTQLHTPEDALGWVASLYFSFATFSTLGFGDIYPRTSTARIWGMAEVMIGYIMLGGLISILANKLAKRA